MYESLSEKVQGKTHNPGKSDPALDSAEKAFSVKVLFYRPGSIAGAAGFGAAAGAGAAAGDIPPSMEAPIIPPIIPPIVEAGAGAAPAAPDIELPDIELPDMLESKPGMLPEDIGEEPDDIESSPGMEEDPPRPPMPPAPAGGRPPNPESNFNAGESVAIRSAFTFSEFRAARLILSASPRCLSSSARARACCS